jgi:ferredoxin-NADP reductase
MTRPPDGERIELTVQQITDGEVSPYLGAVRPGEQIELRGPIGGWFVWQPAEESRVLLVAGGSGIVPLMAMLRQRLTIGSARFRLIYSVRHPGDVYYAIELAELERDCDWLHVTVIYTRAAVPESARPPGRIDTGDLAAPEWAPGDGLRVYVCGPTGFVESATTKLLALGHRPSAIRTERFGPSG